MGVLVSVGRCLASETRVRILKELDARGGAMTTRQLSAALELSEQKVNRHLKTLRQNFVVGKARHGREVLYFLQGATLVSILIRNLLVRESTA